MGQLEKKVGKELLPQVNKFLEDWRTGQDMGGFRYVGRKYCIIRQA
jgi:hypothetical protein